MTCKEVIHPLMLCHKRTDYIGYMNEHELKHVSQTLVELIRPTCTRQPRICFNTQFIFGHMHQESTLHTRPSC